MMLFLEEIHNARF